MCILMCDDELKRGARPAAYCSLYFRTRSAAGRLNGRFSSRFSSRVLWPARVGLFSSASFVSRVSVSKVFSLFTPFLVFSLFLVCVLLMLLMPFNAAPAAGQEPETPETVAETSDTYEIRTITDQQRSNFRLFSIGLWPGVQNIL